MWPLHLLLLSLISSTFAVTPLIFNPYTQEVYNVRGMVDKEHNNRIAFAAACPATEDQFEEDFNTNCSIGLKSLLLRANSDQVYQDMEKIKCQNAFELSIVTIRPKSSKENTYLLNLGYEVYFDKSQYPNDFAITEYQSLGTIAKTENPAAAWFLTPIKKLWSKVREPVMVRENKHEKQQMELSWLPQMRIRYHVPSWSAIRTNYKLYRNAEQIMAQVQCDNYDLGSEVYKNRSLDDFYKPENQKKIFKDVQLPDSLSPNGDCRKNFECVKKYNGVPAYAFQGSPASSVSCTNLTSIPIWYEVAGPLLEYLDKFLVAIAQVTDNRLTIINGSYKTLELPPLEGGNPESIYLYPEKLRLPVPKVVFKMITYMPIKCNPNIDICAYQIAIVIHNEPDFKDTDKLCPEDMCFSWGWDSIQYQSTTNKEHSRKSRHIYCCEINQTFIDKIQWDAFVYPGMNLKQFPHYDAYIARNRLTNKREKFEEVMEKLFFSDGSMGWNEIPNLIFDGNPNPEGTSRQSENPQV